MSTPDEINHIVEELYRLERPMNHPGVIGDLTPMGHAQLVHVATTLVEALDKYRARKCKDDKDWQEFQELGHE